MREVKFVGVDKSIHDSPGSYIVVKPLSKDVKTCQGEVVFDSINKNYKIGNVVFYHEDDTKIINMDNIEYHIILHYHIILKQTSIKEDIKPSQLKFTGNENARF